MDSSPYGLAALWTQSDWVIRGVALALLLMSIASWTVILTRALHLMQVRKALPQVDQFWHTHSYAEGLQVLYRQQGNPFHQVAVDAQAAVNHHAGQQDDLHGQISLAHWLGESLKATLEDVAERLQGGLSVLASVGSTAPFVGLLGTVWGIYHALIGLGTGGPASLDKVAGPVGEALIMTAFGLAVAIPAVLGYNALNRANKGMLSKLQRFSRQLHAYFLTGAPVQKPSALRAVSSALTAEAR